MFINHISWWFLFVSGWILMALFSELIIIIYCIKYVHYTSINILHPNLLRTRCLFLPNLWWCTCIDTIMLNFDMLHYVKHVINQVYIFWTRIFVSNYHILHNHWNRRCNVNIIIAQFVVGRVFHFSFSFMLVVRDMKIFFGLCYKVDKKLEL